MSEATAPQPDARATARVVQEPPLVSVVMPIYNTLPYLQQAIDSILNQTYPHLELLLCDDCSTDGSRELALQQTDPRIRQLHNETNQRPVATAQRAFHAANGAYLTLQDSDDYAHPERIARQVTHLQEHSHLAGVGTLGTYVNEQGLYLRDYFRPHLSPTELREAQRGMNQFIGASILWRRQPLMALGPYRPYFFRNYGDVDLINRALAVYDLANLPDALYHIRMTRGSMSRRIIDLDEYLVAALVQALFEERLQTGTDTLDSGSPADLEALKKRIKQPYLDNPQRFHIERMGQYLAQNLHHEARYHANRLVTENLTSLRAWRHWFYVWRKTL